MEPINNIKTVCFFTTDSMFSPASNDVHVIAEWIIDTIKCDPSRVTVLPQTVVLVDRTGKEGALLEFHECTKLSSNVLCTEKYSHS
jgi:hypothetical protein